VSHQIVQVDAFTDRPFSGNPAAVCLLPSAASDDWMRNVAREMNLSETAFLYPVENVYNLRWFTPSVEVELCGHATLATAHVLFNDGHHSPDTLLRFQTRSGELTARKDGSWIELDFPATPAGETQEPAGLIEALGVTPRFVGKNKIDFLVEAASDTEVRKCAPDFGALTRIGVRGVIITARDTGGKFDFISRGFFPGSGINEDPVTGSAHCTLTPYWAERLSKTELMAFQASERGGVLRLKLDGDRVQIGGQAVTVMRCELL